jgi:RimJ/RimL family protein N-acetyltransferase
LGFSQEEIAQQYRWDRDEKVLYWSGGRRTTLSREQYARSLERQAQEGYQSRESFAILDEEGKLIGRIGYYNLDRRGRRAKLGIVIGEKDYWGRGYGRDAMMAFLKYLFQDRGLVEVHLATFPKNIRAQRSFESCGFKPVGTDREFFLDWGWRDEILMALSREEFLRDLEEGVVEPDAKRRERT